MLATIAAGCTASSTSTVETGGRGHVAAATSGDAIVRVVQPGASTGVVRVGERLVVARGNRLWTSGTGWDPVVPSGDAVQVLGVDHAASRLFVAAARRGISEHRHSDGPEGPWRETRRWPAEGLDGPVTHVAAGDGAGPIVATASGVWRWDPARAEWIRAVETRQPPTGLVTTARGTHVVAGRRVHRVRDGAFVGSTSRIAAAPLSANWSGAFAHARVREDGRTEIGVMDGRFREVGREIERITVDEAVDAIAFDDGRLIATTATSVLVIEREREGHAPDGDRTLVESSRRDRDPALRLFEVAPDEAVLLGVDGSVRAIGPDGVARTTASSPTATAGGAIPLGVPVAADCDGRRIRLWTRPIGAGDAAGLDVRDVALDGTLARAARSTPPERARETLPVTVRTRRGFLAIDAGDARRIQAGGRSLQLSAAARGMVAVDGHAWVATDAGLVVVDPAGPSVLASVAFPAAPRWILPLARGGAACVAADGSVVDVQLPAASRQ